MLVEVAADNPEVVVIHLYLAVVAAAVAEKDRHTAQIFVVEQVDM
jgi:hypothetical protein